MLDIYTSTRDELAELEFAIASEPEAHPVIPGTGGARKARWSRQGMGKRGGIRVIYHLVKSAGLVLMLAAYAKNVKENLSNDEKKPSVASPKPSKKASPKVSLGDLIIRGYEEGIAYAKGELSA